MEFLRWHGRRWVLRERTKLNPLSLCTMWNNLVCVWNMQPSESIEHVACHLICVQTGAHEWHLVRGRVSTCWLGHWWVRWRDTEVEFRIGSCQNEDVSWSRYTVLYWRHCPAWGRGWFLSTWPSWLGLEWDFVCKNAFKTFQSPRWRRSRCARDAPNKHFCSRLRAVYTCEFDLHVLFSSRVSKFVCVLFTNFENSTTSDEGDTYNWQVKKKLNCVTCQ